MCGYYTDDAADWKGAFLCRRNEPEYQQRGRLGLPVRFDDDDAAGDVRLWVLAVPCQRFPHSRVRAEARVRTQDQEVREEGAEEAEAAQVLEEVGKDADGACTNPKTQRKCPKSCGLC